MSDKLLLELYDRVATLEKEMATLKQTVEGLRISEKIETDIVGEVKGKYRYLSDYLVSSGENFVVLTFNEIEDILQEQLPPSARQHRAMWANTQTHAISRSWYNVGYRTVDVDMENEIVKFEKANSAKEGNLTMSKYEPLGKYLERSKQTKIRLTFAEIENILGFKLIDSLKKHEVAWYGASEKSPTHVWKKVWCNYGYQVEKVNLNNEDVVFFKVAGL